MTTLTGVITVEDLSVTGTGTLFITELKIDNFIIIDGNPHQIKSIKDDANMTLVTAANVTDVPYYLENAISKILSSVPNFEPVHLESRIKTLENAISKILSSLDTAQTRIKTLENTIASQDEAVIDLYSIIDEQCDDSFVRISRLESIAGKFILSTRT